jgi:GNAT superfamily N-acetyltransferase
VIESAIRHFGTMDPEVIDERTFYVAVSDAGDILGTGGWSRRVPGYDRIDRAHAETEADFQQRHYIRGVYVRPDRARQGIARTIMTHAEATAAESGAPDLTLTATLTGVPLYKSLDYRSVQSKVVRLPDGLIFEAIEMTKAIGAPVSKKGTGVGHG